MSKIAYTQLVKNIANSYRNATGSSELVAVGELADKIEKAIASADTSNTQYKSISCETGVTEVILPVITDPVAVEINNGNIEIETSATVELVESEE